MLELERAPVGLIRTILDLRAYGRAHQVFVNTKDVKDLPDDEIFSMVFKIDAEIMDDERAKRRETPTP